MRKFIIRTVWIIFLILLANGCAVDTTRSCEPSLMQHILPPDFITEGSVASTPDQGVSVESQAQPNSVCNIEYEIPNGVGAILNLYTFDDIKKAGMGFNTLSDRAATINTEIDDVLQPLSLAGTAYQADDMFVSCYSGNSGTTCRVVARYGFLVYWFSVSQSSESTFINDNLERVLLALEYGFTQNSQ